LETWPASIWEAGRSHRNRNVHGKRAMWKISIVMLVTAIFAGLLLYKPYEVPAKSVAVAPPIDAPPRPVDAPSRPVDAPPRLVDTPPRPVDAPPRLANAVPPSAQAELADELLPPSTWSREETLSRLLGALLGKSTAPLAPHPYPYPLQASNTFQRRHVLQSTAEDLFAQPVLGKRKTYRMEDGRGFERRRREGRWAENVHDSRKSQHSLWRYHSYGRRSSCDDCH